MQKECYLIQELFPLYSENLVSMETAEHIKEHLDKCTCCREAWEHFTEPLLDPVSSKEIHLEKGIGDKLLNRLRRTALVIIFILIIGGFSLAYASYNAGKNVGLDDPSYRLADELGLFTQINQTKPLAGIQVTIDKGLFDSSRTVLFLRLSSSSKAFPEVNLTDGKGHEYLSKSGKSFHNKYYVLEFEPFKLEAEEARVSLSFEENEKIDFCFPVDVTKTVQYTRIIYPNQEKNIQGVNIALEKSVLGVSQSEFKLKIDWPYDGSVAGIALGKGVAFFPTSVKQVPADAPPPPGPVPPGGFMSNYAATYGVNYRSEDPPQNRPALYDLTNRQEVTVQDAEYKTTQFPCQVMASLKFDLVEQKTDNLELLIPPVYLYEKVKEKNEIYLNFTEQEVINVEKSISYQGGKVIVEKVWLEKKRVYISYRIESPGRPNDYLPNFILKDKEGRKQGNLRFDRKKPQVIFFPLINEDTQEVFISLDSVGHLLPRERFTIDVSD